MKINTAADLAGLPAGHPAHEVMRAAYSNETIEWRIALVDLAIVNGHLPSDIQVDRVSLFHTTRMQ